MVDIFGNNIIDAYTSGNPVSKIYSQGTLVWERSTPPTPSSGGSLKFTCVDEPSTYGGRLGFIITSSGSELYWYPEFEWSRDGETWNDWNYNSITGVYDEISVRENQSIYVRGVNNQYTAVSNNTYGSFTMRGGFKCEGNIMHLLDYTQNLTRISNNYCFACLFKDCSTLTTTPDLKATTLSSYCYMDIFNGCSNISSVKIYTTNIGTNSLYGWLDNAYSTGKLYCKSGYKQLFTGNVPSGWTISDTL